MKNAIEVNNLSKVYRLGTKERPESLASHVIQALIAPIKNLRKIRGLINITDTDSDDVLHALKDIKFEVTPGEVLGVIGHNGAGKSTLLKILSKITLPSNGSIKIKGVVASLLEVGTGFHPELTGRENIFLNATLLGMRRKEVNKKIDAIIAFAGIEKFIDTPVKRYSSGMQVRLAFAVAAHLDPEVLIVDEVLAVGDASFQAKCLGKMDEVAKSGKTILFVSHDMNAINRLCSRCIVLDQGQIAFDGDTLKATDFYLKQSKENVETERNGYTDLSIIKRKSRIVPQLQSIRMLVDGESGSVCKFGQTIQFIITYKSDEKRLAPSIGFNMKNNAGRNVIGMNSLQFGIDIPNEVEKECCVVVEVPEICLFGEGYYSLDLGFGDSNEQIDFLTDAFKFYYIDVDVFNSGNMLDKRFNVFVHPGISFKVNAV